MIQWEYPEFFLLLLPGLWLFWKLARQHGFFLSLVRFLAIILLVLALARPSLVLEDQARHLVVVVDRSSSLPANSSRHIKEILGHLQKAKGKSDRMGVVSFGRGAGVEVFPTNQFSLTGFLRPSGQTASDLAEALEMARQVLPSRYGKVLILSDGKYTGVDPTQAATLLAAREAKIDYRYLGRVVEGDVAIEDVSFPDKVEIGKPFQYSVLISSPKSVTAKVVVEREGKILSQRKVVLQNGRNRLVFRDLVKKGGTSIYRVRVSAPDDHLKENNEGLGVVRAEAGPTILVITPNGREDNLTRALRQSLIPLEVISPEKAPRHVSQLDRYRAIILENVSANKLSKSLAAFKSFVVDMGGGLLITGGTRSFGVGGYYKSVLDPILPVSMELRKEHHKLKLAMAIVLDRSGSMAAPASGGGGTKMDLANNGTCAVVDLLTAMDQVGVIAVDSREHIIIPLTTVDDPTAIKTKVRTIRSMGGGIFTYTALLAAAKMLKESNRGTRHVVLFADAADAEQPGKFRSLIPEMVREGMTISVIALGKKSDPDAKFLEEVAALGKGRIFFADQASQLPQLFAQETLTISRSSFVKEITNTKLLPEIRFIGDNKWKKFPRVGGYNLTYIRKQASLAVRSTDEYQAPILACWYRGTGRVAAFTGEVDGKYSGQLAQWGQYPDLFVTLSRWLVGKEAPTGYFVETRREGSKGAVYLEMENPRAAPPTLYVLTPSGKKVFLDFRMEGRGYLAHFPLREFGIYLPVLQVTPQKVVRCPSVTLPYGPEFIPYVQNRPGRQIMAKLARITRGQERLNLAETFKDIQFSTSSQPLTYYLALALLILLLLEVACRRLGLVEAFKVFGYRIWTALPSRPQFKRKKKPAPASTSQGEMGDGEAEAAGEVEEKEEEESPLSLFKKAKDRAQDRM